MYTEYISAIKKGSESSLCKKRKVEKEFIALLLLE